MHLLSWLTERPEGRFALAAAPAGAIMVAFFVVPAGVLFAYSFGHSTYLDVRFGLTFEHYAAVATSETLRNVVLRSLWMGGLVGVAAAVLSYPIAYAATLGPYRRFSNVVLLVVLVSLFTAYIVRIYAWRTLLGRNGIINGSLETLGFSQEPLTFLLFSKFAVLITLISVLIPVAMLPIHASLSGMRTELIDAARTMGATGFQAFRRVTLPMTSRGLYSGFALSFVIAAGDFVTPQLVGDPGSQLAGNAIVTRFGLSFDWPLGAAIAFTLVTGMAIVLVVALWCFARLGLRDRP